MEQKQGGMNLSVCRPFALSFDGHLCRVECKAVYGSLKVGRHLGSNGFAVSVDFWSRFSACCGFKATLLKCLRLLCMFTLVCVLCFCL
uniref:Uncharacterized protein n=1 Tax=Anguilla anguilla TaxID=7936 RepID=A0A0E9T498_ANGAN